MATFTNRATLSYNGGSVDSNVVTGTINETLSLTKNSLLDEYSRGDNVVYVINLTNSGITGYTDLTLTDDLGGTTLPPFDYENGSVQYYVNGVLQPAPAVTATSPLTITGINAPAGANVTILYIADVNGFAPLAAGSSVTNTASVTGSGILNPLVATDTVTVREAPELTITKGLCPTTVIENGTVTYTFTIQNYGNTPAEATDNVVITDTFDPILRNISVVYEGASWTSPANYTYDAATGLFETVAGQITVPAATYTTNPDGSIETIPGSVTLTVTGTV